MIAVSVIIPARDAEPTLGRTLDALQRQERAGEYEVIVVDDGSHDETSAIVRNHAPLVRLIRHERSQGPGAARNRGVQEAVAPVLAFTDADCFPTAGWIAAGLKKLAEADLVQGRVEPDPSVPRTPFDRTLSVGGDGGFYETANLFVRRETFEAVGGFRDWVLEERRQRRWSADRRRGRAARTPIGEDTLFAWTARRLGARSVYAPDALVHHAVVPGSVLEDMADRWHWGRDMPGLARRVPELRQAIFYRRIFFNIVSARFDYALAGLIASALTRRSLWLFATLPYIRQMLEHSGQWSPGQRIAYLAGAPIVEASTLLAFLSGSVAWRSVVL